jgi:hypothetical protein
MSGSIPAIGDADGKTCIHSTRMNPDDDARIEPVRRARQDSSAASS